MRRQCCANVLMSRSPYAAAQPCAAAIRRATRFRAPADFQFFSMSLTVCSYFAPSSLISFFISTTNERTDSGQCFSSAPLVAQASCLWGDRASRLVDYFFSRVAAASPSHGRQDAHRPCSQDGCAPLLARATPADRIRFLWLNTKLRGCPETALGTM